MVCTASDQCHNPGACDPATGVCSNPSKTNGTTCSDGNACTQRDSCLSGACVGGLPVVCAEDGNPCTRDECDTGTGTCIHPPQPTTQGCNDGNGCTRDDHCNGMGACVGGPGCSDGDALNGDELCDANVSCKPAMMGKPVVAYDEAVIERRLGTGRHPVAVSPNRMAVAFVEMMKDMNAAPRIGVATFDHFGAAKGAGRFETTVIDSGPVVAGLPGGGFAVAYTSMGEQGGDGLDVVLRAVSADGVIGTTKVIANEARTLGQRAPDMTWAGDRLVVGWEDESLAGVRQVCWREFSDKLVPLNAPECDGDDATASSLTLAASGSEYARAWRKDGPGGPSVEVKLPGGRRSFALADASSSGAPALVGVGMEWLLVYTESCGVQKAAMLSVAADVVGEYDEQAAPPERYEPSLAVTRSGVYLSWREPAQFVNNQWDARLDELYLDELVLGSTITFSGGKYTLPAGSTLLQGDQANAALVPFELGDTDVVLAAWEDWNPNVTGHCKHGDVLMSLIVTPVVRP